MHLPFSKRGSSCQGTYCKLVEEGYSCYSDQQLMFISVFLSDTNFGLALFTLLVDLTINYNDKIDCFAISDGDGLNWL